MKKIRLNISKARVYIEKGDYEKALNFHSRKLETYEHIGFEGGMSLLNGMIFYYKGNHKKASEYFGKALNEYNNLGINNKHLGESDLAKSNYYKAIEINPNHANAYNNLGILLGALGEYEKSIDALKKALVIEPNFFKAQTNLSVVYTNQQKDSEKAINESYKALGMHHRISKTYTQSLQLFRLKHDVEQTEYLKSKNYKINGLDEFNKIGKEILNREKNQESKSDTNKRIFLKDNEIKSLLPFYKTKHIYRTPKLSKGSLNPDKDWSEVELEYLNKEKQIIYIDDFLSKEAIKEIREFCLTSKVWIHQYNNKYLGAFSDSGFISPIHLQIGTELQEKLPKLFGKYNLGKFWAFKYDTNLGGGIGIHADFAYLNLNFWITPNEYNNDKNRGGLKVYDAPAPEDWSFEKYNRDSKEIYKFIEKKNANCETIPYKFNRAVLFNSAFFHETDKIDFKTGYESRRINITYLFGTRKIKKVN